MKTYIEQRYKEVTESIERYEYQLELLRTELTSLEPKYTAFKQSQRAEREQASKDVMIELEGGVFVRAEKYEEIKSGKTEVIVRGKKQPKPNDNAETIQNDTVEVDTTGEINPDAT